MRRLFFDFETASTLGIHDVGLDRYVCDPSTRVILGAYAYDDEPVKLWQPHKEGLPPELEAGWLEDSVEKVCWNSAFERNILKWLLNIDIPIKCFNDAMILSRYLALPGSLSECCKALGLTEEAKHDGSTLINMFCMPAKPGGQETLFGVSEPIFRTEETNPVEWKQFCEYCRYDVVAERAILKRLEPFPLPQREKDAWVLDQEINDRGVLTDTGLVAGGSWIAEKVKGELLERLGSITGLENPNSRDQMLGWARERGYPFHSMGKAFVNRALGGEGDLTPECKEALAIRQQAAKTSATKLISIANQTSSDGRLRSQFSYMGARTGRWTSGGGE